MKLDSAVYSLLEARKVAQRYANETKQSVLVFRSILQGDKYGIALTVPSFGSRVGDRIYPDNERGKK